jgi:hypothetical protein
MRAVVIGILALMCVGCAAAPSFDLVSRDPESPWLVGQRWVRTESSRATVNASYDRTFLDHLVFAVEVVNQGDAPLVVDPAQFSFTIASSSGNVPRWLRHPFAAENPAKVEARLDHELKGDAGLGGAVLDLVGTVAVVALAVTVMDLDPAASGSDGYVDGTEDRYQQAVAAEHAQDAEHRRSCQRALARLLSRTELAPGESLRGEVWFPAWPLRRAIDADTPPEYHDSISTAPGPPRAPSDHALTLRTPEALGGQEIDYSISAW